MHIMTNKIVYNLMTTARCSRLKNKRTHTLVEYIDGHFAAPHVVVNLFRRTVALLAFDGHCTLYSEYRECDRNNIIHCTRNIILVNI